MIRFRDKPKGKAANANTQVKEAAATVAPAQVAPTLADVENIAEAAPPLAKADPEKSDDTKK